MQSARLDALLSRRERHARADVSFPDSGTGNAESTATADAAVCRCPAIESVLCVYRSDGTTRDHQWMQPTDAGHVLPWRNRDARSDGCVPGARFRALSSHSRESQVVGRGTAQQTHAVATIRRGSTSRRPAEAFLVGCLSDILSNEPTGIAVGPSERSRALRISTNAWQTNRGPCNDLASHETVTWAS
jgi:hypothetical protein